MAGRGRKPPPRSRWLRWASAISLVIGVVALVLLVRRLGPSRIVDELTLVGWGFALACAVHLSSLLLDAAMLRFCAGKAAARTHYRLYAHAMLVGHAINEATPMAQLGELTKFNILDEKLPAARAAGALVLQNLIRFVINASFLVVLPPIGMKLLGVTGPLAVAIVVLAACFAVVGAAGLVVIRRGVGEWPFRLLGRLGMRKRRLNRLHSKWNRIDKVRKEKIADSRRMTAAVALGVLSRCVPVVEMTIILAFLGQANPFTIALLVQPALYLVAFATSFVPLQAGATEGGAYILFAAAGLPPHVGVSMELVRKLRRLAFVSLGVLLLGVSSYRDYMVEREEAEAAE